MAGSSWATYVAEGRLLVAELSQRQWALGDLALRVEPMGVHGGVGSGVLEHLARFAYEINVDPETLRAWRDLASRWPSKSRRLDLSWSVHQALGWEEDRHELIRSRKRWTVREARDLVAERRSREERLPDGPSAARRPAPGSSKPDGIPAGVRWADVYRVLRAKLADHPGLLDEIRRELLPLFSGRAS